MHRALKEALSDATGESQFVVAVFVDVRGFSSFAGMAESSEAAVFLRSVYLKILNEYFPLANFFKPTGDGLLIILAYDKESLADTVNLAIAQSVKLVENFPAFCHDDPMVNFEVPHQLGIGIARGAATRLVAKRKIIDYSGRPLNMAARLMDLARPAGVVFSANLGADLLAPELMQQFVADEVYVKGIADEQPMPVFSLSKQTVIPEFNRRPLVHRARKTTKVNPEAFKIWQERALWMVALPSDAITEESLRVLITHPKVRSNGTKHPEMKSFPTYDATVMERGGKAFALVDFSRIVDDLTKRGVKKSWPVSFCVEYTSQS